jgi:hypothetical protein
MKKSPNELQATQATELSLEEQAKAALQNPDFFQRFVVLESASKVYPEMHRIPDDLAARILMAAEVYERFGNPVLMPKEDGVTSGFRASLRGQPMLFVKDFLGEEASGKDAAAELWAYKFLELMRVGPGVEALCAKGKVPFLVSHGLQGERLLFGQEANDYLEHHQDDQQIKTTIIVLEFLAKVLGLGDIKYNNGNFLLRLDEEGEHRPYIVDFHFKPEANAVLSRTKSELTLPGMRARLEREDTVGAALGMVKPFTGTGLEEKTYRDAMAMIKFEDVNAAIEASLKYCDEFFAQITDSELKESRFNRQDLEKYIAQVRANFTKLYEVRKGSVESMKSFLDSGIEELRKDSDGYVAVFGEEGEIEKAPDAQVKPVADSNVVDSAQKDGQKGGCCVVS